MNSQDMRKLMQKLTESTNSLPLREDYDSRVREVIDYINRFNPEGVTKDNFPNALAHAGRSLNVLELKSISGGSGTARAEFMHDVWKGVKKFKKPNASEEKSKKLLTISQYIQDAVGNTFPDGDPFDHLKPKLRRLGLNDDNMMDWLNAATKKHLGFKDYYAYLAAVWDDFARDSGDMLNIKPEDNPWR